MRTVSHYKCQCKPVSFFWIHLSYFQKCIYKVFYYIYWSKTCGICIKLKASVFCWCRPIKNTKSSITNICKKSCKDIFITLFLIGFLQFNVATAGSVLISLTKVLTTYEIWRFFIKISRKLREMHKQRLKCDNNT